MLVIEYSYTLRNIFFPLEKILCDTIILFIPFEELVLLVSLLT